MTVSIVSRPAPSKQFDLLLPEARHETDLADVRAEAQFVLTGEPAEQMASPIHCINIKQICVRPVAASGPPAL